MGSIKTVSTAKTVITALVGVPIQLYKTVSPLIADPQYFQFIASQNKLFNEETLRQVKATFRTATDINQSIKPVYAHAKEDAREFVPISKDEFNLVIGLNLTYEANSPEKANNYVRFLGEYIRNCLLYVTLYNYIRNEHSHSISEMNRYENEIIDFQFQLLQNTNKLKDIRAILTNYPESSKIENRQLVSVQERGERFLAPVTQLVGIESTIPELRQNLSELERDREKFAIRAEYFSRCNSELAITNRGGESLFFLLNSVKNEAFKNKDLSKDTVKEVFNNLSNDLQAFELSFFSNSRFVSGPTIPETHIKPRKSLMVVVSCLVSFLLLVIVPFVLHWLNSNKEKIVSANSESV